MMDDQHKGAPLAKTDFSESGGAQHLPGPLGNAVMVGAYYRPDDGMLSENDQNFLMFAILKLKHLKVEADPALYNAGRFGAHQKQPCNLDILNIDPAYGGRDFLKETNVKGDLLMFCNVAWYHSQYEDATHEKSLVGMSDRQKALYTASFRVSEHNSNEALWNLKARATDAKVIVVGGADDFPPEKLAGKDFVILKSSALQTSLMFKRDYLQALAPQLREANSDLVQVLDVLRDKPETVSFLEESDPENRRLRYHPISAKTSSNARFITNYNLGP